MLKKPHIDKSEEFIPDVLQCMKSAMNVETWNAAHAEYKNLLKDEEQMKQIPDRVRTLYILSNGKKI